jgi:class 3 adenylate cyclase/tetratricopeptide (TPR) repeat protein
MTAGRAADRDARKVVTVLFSDITGSTGIGRALDPESLQHLLSRYFAEMKVIVERHEGVVSKFIGDAVMAVFGLPRVHEDDALRAVRAAAEMRRRLAELNEEFASNWDVEVAIRTGVNTGEVLAREPEGEESLVVGDAVNTAARLEQAAQPGEILIGAETYRLVHDAVRAEDAGPLELRGLGEVRAWRLVDVAADVAGQSRRLDSPMVDRQDELAQLEEAFLRVTAAGTCELATVMAPAGVGKSRLIAELLSRLGSRAQVLQGRCLPYGEGITFWPVASVLKDALGIDDRDTALEARRKIAAAFDGDGDADAVCDGLAPLLGHGPNSVGIQESYWSVRRLLERLGGRGAVVVVFDDIHWGETSFLDLVEYLADWIRSAPVLLVCQARPELLDVRPGWITPRENASLVTLQPLTTADTKLLIQGLVGGTDLPEEARSRIAGMAEGNPLFVEETVRMLVDDGLLRLTNGRWTITGDLAGITIPPTINALLAARLDRLEPDERAVIERASTIGRSFWWGAVAELAPPDARARVGACLQSLVRKQLIEPYRSELPQQDSFRFRHILVRDAAYEAIPRSRRADMHERVAEWLAEKTRDVSGQYEEIVGYHLEQAHRALAQLGTRGDRGGDLARRAAVPLGSAGERAFARGDMPAAVNLLSRATRLLPSDDARRLQLLPDLAFASLETGDFEGLARVAGQMDEAAAETGDAGLQAHAIVIGLLIRVFTNPEGWAEEAEREGHRAIAMFDALEDERGLARAWSLLGMVQCMYGRFASSEDAWSRAVEHARRAGNRRDALEALSWVPGMVAAGPTPAEEALRRCRETFAEAQGDRKAMSCALFSQAGLEALLGRFDEARELSARARALLEEVALPAWIAGPLAHTVGWTELLAQDPPAAERELRRAFEVLTMIGELAFLSTTAAILAEALYAQGRYDEAEHFTKVSEESAGAEDTYSQVLWRSSRAKVLARQGEVTDALRLIGEAAAIVESTDCLQLRWHTLMSQAETMRLAGRFEQARDALEAAIRVAERKQILVGVRMAREVLREIGDVRAAPGGAPRDGRTP